jgi:hypothetical protein
MKTIIAGSRKGVDIDDFLDAIDGVSWEITEVISGGAEGVDSLAEAWADNKKLPLKIYEADWVKDKNAAGFIRNERMINESGAEALLAIWDGQSKGTSHMIKIARKKGLKVQIHFVTDSPLGI